MRFATIEDVEARMGRGLAQAEREIAEYVLAAVSDAIAGEFDVPDDPPAVVRLIVVEKAVGALNNPQGLASFSEQIGSYQRSGTYPRAADVGIRLSDAERRMIRRALGSTFRPVPLRTPYT
jgi:hypothetical protein